MAAADTSRSPGGSADSYVGSVISLTSKSEIRYEGVLFTINPEESSIGLRNVRSFGTEGRKKDGPQVPPSDKVYDYIVFRGTDIKDLQVKSSPPAPLPAAPMHHDPAIIQSHYPVFSTAPTSIPPVGIGSVSDTVSQSPQQQGQPGPILQGNLPLPQPGGPLAPWGGTTSATNPAGLAMPLYWQQYYGASNGLQPPQQSMLQPSPPGLSMPSVMNQPFQLSNSPNFLTSQLSENPIPLVSPFGGGSLQLPNAPSDLPSSQLSETPTSMVPSFSGVSLNSQPPAGHTESSVASNVFMNFVGERPSAQIPPATVPLTTNFPFASAFTSGFDRPVTSPPIIDKPNASVPSLVTPGQLLQPVAPAVTLSQSLETVQKDVQVVQVSSSETPPLPAAPSGAPETAPNLARSSQPPATEVQEPILPLPSPLGHKLNESSANRHYGYRGGRGRGRGYGRHQAARFTEEFDFTAMNEKFNKDEVWGSLGKSHTADEDGDGILEEDNAEASKPVYVKDDFFDTLSCDALDGSRNGRTRFSEQLKKDTETFGEFSRHRGGRGGRGHYHGGYSRGSYYGRGYGYSGRSRGYGPPR